MGAIRRKRDGALVPLPNQLIVGRAPACDLVLSPASVSSNHAILRWQQESWIIRDLASRNGTYLNGRRVGSSARDAAAFHSGDELAFAERDEAWVVVDDAPPRPSLLSEDGSPAVALSESAVIAWPSEESARGYIYCESAAWKLEDVHGNVRELKEGDRLVLGSATFRVHLPAPAPETPPAREQIAELTIERVSLDIRISADEETAAVTAELSGDSFALPARTHFYLLAHLARQRLAGAARDSRAEAEGWVAVEEVCRDLALPTPEALAVTVHRCRKDFERLGFREASRLVDRARRGLLRIGVPPDRLRVQHERV